MRQNRAVLCKLLLASTLIGGVSSCAPEPPPTTFLSIQTSRISEANFSPAIEAISPLESTTNVAVKPQINGTVVQILATAGQPVKAGQVILVLDNVQQSAALDASRSEARKDILNAERYEYLYEQGAVSAKERDRYATEAEQAKDDARSDAAAAHAPADAAAERVSRVELPRVAARRRIAARLRARLGVGGVRHA